MPTLLGPVLAHAGLDELPAPLTAMRRLTGWVFEPIAAIGDVVVGA